MSRVAVGVLAALLLAGCAGSTGGAAEPEEEQPPQGNGDAGSEVPHSGAPAVPDPIVDTSEFERDPCAILPEEELEEAGFAIDPEFTEPEPQYEDGSYCGWFFKEAGQGGFSLGLNTANTDGLSHIYRLEAEDMLELFEEQDPIQGHPAVLANQYTDREELEDEGRCRLYVGLRDDLALYVPMSASQDNPLGDEPCEAARDVATIAVETMTGGT